MASEIFTLVDDMVVVLESRGTYRQCPVYRLDKFLFAKAGGGFVRLKSDGTSNGWAIYHIIVENGFLWDYDKLGRMVALDKRSEG